MTNEFQPVPLVSNQLEMMKICESSRDIGMNYHIHIRHRIPDVRDYKGIDAEKWDQFRDQLEKEYEWEPEHRIEWNEYDHISRKVIRYVNHLSCGITIQWNSQDEMVKLLFDHGSTPELVERLKRELESMKEN